MVYAWKSASRIKADAQKAGEVCEQLENTVGLTAKNLLNASREEDAPLHNEFEWRDNVAAEKYREEQAAHIIRCLCVKPEEEKNEPVRAFFTIQDNRYESTVKIVADTQKQNALLDMALKELEVFKKKYSQLKELASVFKAIEEINK